MGHAESYMEVASQEDPNFGLQRVEMDMAIQVRGKKKCQMDKGEGMGMGRKEGGWRDREGRTREGWGDERRGGRNG